MRRPETSLWLRKDLIPRYLLVSTTAGLPLTALPYGSAISYRSETESWRQNACTPKRQLRGWFELLLLLLLDRTQDSLSLEEIEREREAQLKQRKSEQRKSPISIDLLSSSLPPKSPVPPSFPTPPPTQNIILYQKVNKSRHSFSIQATLHDYAIGVPSSLPCPLPSLSHS